MTNSFFSYLGYVSLASSYLSVVFLVGLQSSTARMTLTEELLFVRKIQAIIDFCSECKNLLKAFRLELSITESKQLCLPK